MDPPPFLTPPEQFFIQNGGEGSITGWEQPTYASANDWSMKILDLNGGELLTVTYDDVLAAAQQNPDLKISLLKTIQCVLESPVRLTATGFTGNAYWTGIPLQYFLDQAGLDYSASSSVKRFVLTGADGFQNNIKVGRITQSEEDGLIQPLLVYEMNGQPLPQEGGFPIRLIIQEGLGYKNVKWLTEVRPIRFDVAIGTYQDQGFVDDGIMRVSSRSTSLSEQISLPAGTIEITGFALSGFGSITEVAVQIDGGDFMPAEIIPLEEIQDEASLPPTILQLQSDQEYPFQSVWTPWRFRWEATSGNHVVAIRATDSANNVQPEVDNDIKDGQTGITTYDVSIT